MTVEDAKEKLYFDYLDLAEKFDQLLPASEFGYTMIKITTKMLLDNASSHFLVLEGIRTATAQGIKWHVEEKEVKDG